MEPYKNLQIEDTTPYGFPPDVRRLKLANGDIMMTNQPENYIPEKPSLVDGMPPLYKPVQKQEKSVVPPGERPPDDATLARMEFAKGVVKEIGFNPIGFDPINEARSTVQRQYEAKYGQGATNNPQFQADVNEYTKRLIAKKAAATERMKFEFERYDKEITLKEAQQKPKTDVQRLEGALTEKLGRPPSDQEFIAEQQKMKANSIPPVRVPTGYRTTEDGGMEPVPGGPADIKRQTDFTKDTAALEGITSDVSRLGRVAKELKDHPGLSRITGIIGKIPNIPGSDAANAEGLLGTLKSQVAFSVLQTMRNNSKTGGALGQVSDKEGQLLQDNLAALDKAQSYKAYQDALQKIIDYTDGSISRTQKAYDLKWGDKKEKSGTGSTKPRLTPAQAIDELRRRGKI
jgi:hypothetical protein